MPLTPLVFGSGLMVMQSQQTTNQTPISKEVLAIIDEAFKLVEEDIPEFDKVSMLPKNYRSCAQRIERTFLSMKSGGLFDFRLILGGEIREAACLKSLSHLFCG
jgi:hypothetical protein